MKELKIYIQRSLANAVVNRLYEAHAPEITIVGVHPVGYGYEPNYFDLRFGDVLRRYKHHDIVKLELVCSDEDVDRFVSVIESECQTGGSGDGWIFVSQVEEAIRIRDHLRGELNDDELCEMPRAA